MRDCSREEEPRESHDIYAQVAVGLKYTMYSPNPNGESWDVPHTVQVSPTSEGCNILWYAEVYVNAVQGYKVLQNFSSLLYLETS